MCFPALLAAVPAALGTAGAAAGAAGAGAAAAGGLASVASTLGTVASVAGTGLAVLGQVNAGKAAQNAAEYQAKVGTMQARDAQERGALEEDKTRQRSRALLGSQKAALGAGGLDTSSGSALDLLGSTAAIGELDALTVKSNTNREVWGYKAGAEMSRAQGANAAQAGIIGGIGTALGGTATVADKWYRMLNPQLGRA